MAQATFPLGARVQLRTNPAFHGTVVRHTQTRHRNPIRLYVVRWSEDPQTTTHRLGDLQCCTT